MDHYFSGGYYPAGGGASIVKAMTSAIKRYGGDVRTSQPVSKIVIESDGSKGSFYATGVQLQNGEIIQADRVISNADPEQTYNKLIGKE